MAPVPSPPEQKESFALDGSGVLLLTDEQRQAKTLSISVEKVALEPRVEYFNFRTPEPQGFWGYLQLVRRDFIEETIQLEYRRQLIYSWHQPVLDPIEQLRCLVKDSTLLLFDSLTPLLLAAGGDAQQIGQDRANYLLRNGQPRLIPVAPVTGIYYEIEPDRAALVTLIWRGYSLPCEQPLPPQIQESPRAPGKDESGPGGNDGGGTRPVEPPPPERSSDPDSDNSAPPPGEPPIPTPDEPIGPPPRGAYRVTLDVEGWQSSSAPCVPVAGGPQRFVYEVNPGPALVEKTFPPAGGYVWKIFDADANFVANITGSSSRADCESEVTVVSQVLIE